MSWLEGMSRGISDAHNSILPHFPSHATESGFFSPLNCFGQQDAINNAYVEVSHAAQKAATAADETFLVKPVNLPMPQALNSSRLLVVHNDAAAKAAAHLQLALKNLKAYRTIGADGLSVSGMEQATIAAASLDPTCRKTTHSDFIFGITN